MSQIDVETADTTKTDLLYCIQNVWFAILVSVGSNTKVYLAGILVGLKSLSDA